MEALPQHIWIGFAGGLLGFAHCLGMCGGFALHLSQGQTRRGALVTQLFWLTGKLTGYLFLGALTGFAGGIFVSQLNLGQFQNILSYLSGAVIIWAGLSLLGLLPYRAANLASRSEGFLTPLLRTFITAPSPGAALVFGLGTGLLPCPIVLAFLSYALQSGSALTGMVTMGGLGIGTTVPLLLLGGFSRLSGIHLRRWAPQAGGILLILLGLTTVLRGTATFHHLLGCPANPAPHALTAPPTQPCCTGEPHGNRSGN
jgi:uncharacterized protein